MPTRKKITVAVTGLNNIDSPGPGIPVIRSLKESVYYNVRIIGLSYESLEPGIYLKNLVDKTYQIPNPSNGVNILMDRLEYITNKEHIDVVIPNFDAELYNFIKIAPQLEKKLKIKTYLPSIEQFENRQKWNLFEFGEKIGIQVPFSKSITSISELNNLGDNLEYPLFIKGKYYNAYIANNKEQAQYYFNSLSAQWGLPIIVQQFVTGTEVNVTAIGDGKGNCIGAVPMRKLYITDKGKAWSGVSLHDDTLIAITKKVMAASKWKGGCELEFIKTKTNDYYLIEMNPRFPAWVYLATACGQNHPEALVKMAMNENVAPYTTYDKGKMFIRYSFDQIVNLADFEKISTLGEL